MRNTPITAADTRSVAEIRADLRAKGIEQLPNSRHGYLHYQLPDQDEVRVATVTYNENWGDLSVYYPSGYSFSETLPAVILMPAYADKEMRSGQGASNRESNRAMDWASLFACEGIAAIIYDTGSPYFSARDAMKFLDEESANLHIDTTRLGIFVVYNQIEIATKILSKPKIPCVAGVKALAVLYGLKYLGPLAHPIDIYLVTAGKAVDDSKAKTELFAKQRQAQGCEVTLVDYEEGFPFFDSVQDGPRTVELIQETLNFFVDRLLD